jgi:hypothetical protein
MMVCRSWRGAACRLLSGMFPTMPMLQVLSLFGTELDDILFMVMSFAPTNPLRDCEAEPLIRTFHSVPMTRNTNFTTLCRPGFTPPLT